MTRLQATPPPARSEADTPSPRRSAGCAAARRQASSPTSPPGILTSRGLKGSSARSIGRGGRNRDWRAVLGSAGRRPGDPARDRTRAGLGHDLVAASSICSIACGRTCGRRSSSSATPTRFFAWVQSASRTGPSCRRGRSPRSRPANRGSRQFPEHARGAAD